MFLLGLPAALTVSILAGCGNVASVDYGDCLKEEGRWVMVTVPSSWPNGLGLDGQPALTLTNTGGVSIRNQYVVSCTEWQYPTGKPTTLR